MLSKLLKYDFKSASRFGLPVAIILAVATVLGFGGGYLFVYWANMLENDPGNPIIGSWEVGFIWGVVALMFAVVGAVIGMQIIIMVDYYRSLVTDEGYLTFTLPVTPKQILASKLINSCIWNLIVTVLCVAIIFAVELGIAVGGEHFGVINSAENEMIDLFATSMNDAWNNVLTIIAAPVTFINEQLVCFMGIFMGAVIAKKHKALAAVGCIAGINFVYGIVKSIGETVMTSIFVYTDGPMGEYDWIEVLENMTFVDNIMLVASIIGLTAFNVLFFYITTYMMEKKLNLA